MTGRPPAHTTSDDDARRASSRRVVAAQLGDRVALDALLREIQEPLFRHVSFLLGAEDAAEDALQEILLTISRKLGSLRDPRWFRAWSFRLATRLAIRHARRRRTKHVLVDIDQAEELLAAPAPDEAPFDESQLATLRGALDAVPPASQLVLRMHYEHGLTHAEIAEALDISPGTVKSRHHYGLQWLRRHMAEERTSS